MTGHNSENLRIAGLQAFRELVASGDFRHKDFLPYARGLDAALKAQPKLLPIGIRRRSYRWLLASWYLEKIGLLLLGVLWGFPPYIVYHTYRWDPKLPSANSLIHYAFPVLLIALAATGIAVLYLIFFRYKTAYLEMLDTLIAHRQAPPSADRLGGRNTSMP